MIHVPNGLESEALKELIFDLIYRLLHTEIFMGVCAMLCLVSPSCPILCKSMDCSPPGSFVHRDSPGKNTGVHCHALLQGIFPTQGSNPGLLYCSQTLYRLNYQGSLVIPNRIPYNGILCNCRHLVGLWVGGLIICKTVVLIPCAHGIIATSL